MALTNIESGNLAAVVSAMALAQASLSAHTLLLRRQHVAIYTPLALVFIAIAVSLVSAIMDAPAFEALPVYLRHSSIALSFFSDMLYLPFFWLYVRAITAETVPNISRKDVWHFLLAMAGFAIMVVVLFTPEADRSALFDTGRDTASPLQTFLFFAIIILYVSWLAQWIVYAILILKRLIKYRRRLRDLFATTNHLELGWIGWLGVLLLIDWVWVTIVFLLEAFTELRTIEEPWLNILDFVVVWSIAAWGLRQKPGLAHEVAVQDKQASTKPRYEKSALDEDDISRLKARIEAAMQDDHLFLEPNLSLSMLATHIGARANYVSQTLNSGFEATFFDYINQWRVQHAQEQLLSSDASVLEIALASGFNTRSSFYAAFKRITGTTPSSWRKARLG